MKASDASETWSITATSSKIKLSELNKSCDNFLVVESSWQKRHDRVTHRNVSESALQDLLKAATSMKGLQFIIDSECISEHVKQKVFFLKSALIDEHQCLRFGDPNSDKPVAQLSNILVNIFGFFEHMINTLIDCVSQDEGLVMKLT